MPGSALASYSAAPSASTDACGRQMVGAPDAPGVPFDNADHRDRTRRVESAHALPAAPCVGMLRNAPAAEPARPAIVITPRLHESGRGSWVRQAARTTA